MNFKAYDILSSLVPGFIVIIVMLDFLGLEYNNNYVVAYTAIAFLLGYMMNTISSWLEDFYYWTWGGKPSDKLLDGKDIWKVKFYHGGKAKALLQNDNASNPNASNDELFSIAMRYGNGNARIDDFNAMYAFARVLLTTVLIAGIVLIISNYAEWKYYTIVISIIVIAWLRCKQRGYYYAREVLNVYLKSKSS